MDLNILKRVAFVDLGEGKIIKMEYPKLPDRPMKTETVTFTPEEDEVELEERLLKDD